jgi:hypothetical protein
MGTTELKWSTVRKNILCTGPTGAAEAEQKSLVPARQAQQTNQEEGLLSLYSLSPHLPQFQQSAGTTPLYNSLISSEPI